jgi:16S rRNA (guanine966-N2)-methyltransferase
MRVEGGSARGIELRAPRSRRVRPVTSLTRQAIFSILEHSDSEWEVVLDLFAGSGALGIEALSRGASWADFVDNNHECCTVIKQNLERTALAAHAHVHCMPAHRASEELQRRYDVVFIDPPYDDPSTADLVSALTASSILAPGALLVVSHGDRHPLADAYGAFASWKQRRYGDSHVTIYRGEES